MQHSRSSILQAVQSLSLSQSASLSYERASQIKKGYDLEISTEDPLQSLGVDFHRAGGWAVGKMLKILTAHSAQFEFASRKEKDFNYGEDSNSTTTGLTPRTDAKESGRPSLSGASPATSCCDPEPEFSLLRIKDAAASGLVDLERNFNVEVSKWYNGLTRLEKSVAEAVSAAFHMGKSSPHQNSDGKFCEAVSLPVNVLLEAFCSTEEEKMAVKRSTEGSKLLVADVFMRIFAVSFHCGFSMPQIASTLEVVPMNTSLSDDMSALVIDQQDGQVVEFPWAYFVRSSLVKRSSNDKMRAINAREEILRHTKCDPSIDRGSHTTKSAINPEDMKPDYVVFADFTSRRLAFVFEHYTDALLFQAAVLLLYAMWDHCIQYLSSAFNSSFSPNGICSPPSSCGNLPMPKLPEYGKSVSLLRVASRHSHAAQFPNPEKVGWIKTKIAEMGCMNNRDDRELRVGRKKICGLMIDNSSDIRQKTVSSLQGITSPSAKSNGRSSANKIPLEISIGLIQSQECLQTPPTSLTGMLIKGHGLNELSETQGSCSSPYHLPPSAEIDLLSSFEFGAEDNALERETFASGTIQSIKFLPSK